MYWSYSVIIISLKQIYLQQNNFRKVTIFLLLYKIL